MSRDKKINSLIQKAKRIEKELSEIKELYSQLDEITSQLRVLKFKGNDQARIVDNFKNKDVVYRTTSVKRFYLEIG